MKNKSLKKVYVSIAIISVVIFSVPVGLVVKNLTHYKVPFNMWFRGDVPIGGCDGNLCWDGEIISFHLSQLFIWLMLSILVSTLLVFGAYFLAKLLKKLKIINS
jgi:hypothetical protein